MLGISVEISMYPLDPGYVPPIEEFISYLNEFSEIKCQTNCMSTQVFGSFQDVTKAVNSAMQRSMQNASESNKKVVFVTKWLNTNLSN